jgi:hypothetical protein
MRKIWNQEQLKNLKMERFENLKMSVANHGRMLQPLGSKMLISSTRLAACSLWLAAFQRNDKNIYTSQTH